MKRPAFQFYPADWRKDAALQSCSLAARGLWLEAMCVAHECEPYGHLTVNGKPMTPAQIARLVGISARECSQLLAELNDAGVSSITDQGGIFSRRMVRDEDLRNRRASGGPKGAEHGVKGAEAGSKGGRPPKARGVSEPPSKPPPSSSSSSSRASEANASAGKPAGGIAEKPKSADEAGRSDLWKAAVDVLQAGGCKAEAVCRTFMGKLVGDYGFEIARDAVASAVSNQPIDAREFLKATCMRLKGERGADHCKPLTVPMSPALIAAEAEAAEAHRKRAEEIDAIPPEKRAEIAAQVRDRAAKLKAVV